MRALFELLDFGDGLQRNRLRNFDCVAALGIEHVFMQYDIDVPRPDARWPGGIGAHRLDAVSSISRISPTCSTYNLSRRWWREGARSWRA